MKLCHPVHMSRMALLFLEGSRYTRIEEPFLGTGVRRFMKQAYINGRMLMGLLLLIIVYCISRQMGMGVSGTAKAVEKKPVVVIDAGHGGNVIGREASYYPHRLNRN